jgi:hypothetical protein
MATARRVPFVYNVDERNQSTKIDKQGYDAPRTARSTLESVRLPPTHPHQDVAARFRYFLLSVGLGREEFAAATDNAIDPRSLFPILNGTRRPSRALAVLIERTWGFRADYLLEGEGEMWLRPEPVIAAGGGEGLSRPESRVLGFMRRSVSHARAIESQLEQASAWSRLFERLLEIARELDACGRSDSASNLLIYPLFAKLVYRDCIFMAEKYEQLMTLLHRRRIHLLTDHFIRHFVEGVPRETLPAAEVQKLEAMLRPVVEHRREALKALEESLAALRSTVENICKLGSVAELVHGHERRSPLELQRELVERLVESAPEELRGAARGLVSSLRSDVDPRAMYWKRLQRLLRDLLNEVDAVRPAPVETLSPEELRARYDALLEPLTA